MNAVDYEEISVALRALLVRLSDRLPGRDQTLIAEFINAGELGLALEQMADVLSEDQHALTHDEGADLLALAERMASATVRPEPSSSVLNEGRHPDLESPSRCMYGRLHRRASGCAAVVLFGVDQSQAMVVAATVTTRVPVRDWPSGDPRVLTIPSR